MSFSRNAMPRCASVVPRTMSWGTKTRVLEGPPPRHRASRSSMVHFPIASMHFTFEQAARIKSRPPRLSNASLGYDPVSLS